MVCLHILCRSIFTPSLQFPVPRTTGQTCMADGQAATQLAMTMLQVHVVQGLWLRHTMPPKLSRTWKA